MLVPIEWINDYIDIKDITTEEFCDRMIMSGSNIETCEHFCEGIENVVVGRIEKIEQHPDADKLVVCSINVGAAEAEGKAEGGLLQIVTGATNVFEGAYVPVALHNSHIPGPFHGQPKHEGGEKVTKGKLRGIESFGMLCSAGELGFEDKVVPVAHRDGIWILDPEVHEGIEEKIGEDFAAALQLRQAVVDFEITPNRPDCLAMIGMAREAAATFDRSFEYPDITLSEEGDHSSSDFVGVEIKNTENCRRYVARIVTDVVVKQSPWWLQKRLMYAGMRPINNIVDFTNFVMLEYGQPLHAFDIRQVHGGKIIVDNAEAGDTFTTLDESERNLEADMLMIKDAERNIAVAGVMGGLNSEIADDTETIVIESANFNGDSIRTTAKKLGLRTEASARFEKGIDPNLTEDAADRVCKLIEMTGAGKVLKGSVDVYPNPVSAKTMDVRVSRINYVLGIRLPREEMVKMLEGLEIKVEGQGNIMTVTPPTVRQDLLEEEDYIEEIARIYGYDKLPVTLPKSNNEAGMPYERYLRDIAREALCSMGLNEIQTYSFVSPSGVDRIGIAEDSWERAFVRIINPMGEDTSVMRTVLTPNMMDVLARNYSRNAETVKAFEIGNTFMDNPISTDKLPDEDYALCIGMYGKEEDFFTLKGVIQELLVNLGIKGVSFVPESDYEVYHPGRCARVLVEASEAMKAAGEEFEELGIMGEIHPTVAENYGMDGVRVYCCELMFGAVIRKANTEIVYTPLPKYPSTSRDIALLVEEEMEVGSIEKVIIKNGGSILESVRLFDVYRGKQVEEGKKSVAFTLVYRDPGKTLTDEEVSTVHNGVLESLKDELGAVLREM
ncbi:MAG: phenylalanine--tRNA ligase subunit beta [Eubacteriales bacterium]|nr:phenylalanine--tRNA ligase subunit beta [Eubacteriales bacterium]